MHPDMIDDEVSPVEAFIDQAWGGRVSAFVQSPNFTEAKARIDRMAAVVDWLKDAIPF